ncbi:MAG: TadG family pilus assembly protein [Dongiaceae bacterium]
MNWRRFLRGAWQAHVRAFFDFRSFLKDDFRNFLKDDRGAVVIYSTFAMFVFLGFSALAIDGSYLYLMKNRAQSAADAAALSGATQLPDSAAATNTAIEYASKNLSVADYGTVLVATDVETGQWDADTRIFTPDEAPGDAVRVTVRMSEQNANPVRLFLASIFGNDEADIAASAVATSEGSSNGLGDSCLQALNPSASNAFRVVGKADIHGTGCNIQVDSCHASDAFNASGVPDIDLTVELDDGGIGSGELHVCGGMSTTPNVNLPPAQHVHAETGLSVGDPFDRAPFDNLPDANETASCENINFSRSGNAALQPGVYCGGIELTGSGTATMQPGTYYIKDGPLKVTGSRALSGDGVTFVMVGSAANLQLGGVSSMAISAPTTGDYAGFVFFGDRENPATGTHKIHGTPLGGFNGIAYFPNAHVEMVGTTSVGNAPGSDDCSVLIADTMFFNGTVDLHLATECSDYQDTPAFQASFATAKLVD